MNFLDKHFFLLVYYNDCYYSVSKRKKQICCRVYNDFYDFIVNHYSGTFADFLDRAMKEYVQRYSSDYVKYKFNR